MQELTTVAVDQTAPPPQASNLSHQHVSGANWFFSVAALSVINSILMYSGSDWHFIFGLGITQIIDGVSAGLRSELAAESALVFTIIGFVLSLTIMGLFVLFGWFAKKGHLWSFMLGMAFYALDGLIFVLVSDWLAVGFHVFALWGMFRGLQGLRNLRQVI